MKEIYFMVHVYERSEGDDSIVKFIVSDKITREILEKEIQETAGRYSYDDDGYDDVEKMIEDILDTVAESLHSLWSYCDTIKPVTINLE